MSRVHCTKDTLYQASPNQRFALDLRYYVYTNLIPPLTVTVTLILLLILTLTLMVILITALNEDFSLTDLLSSNPSVYLLDSPTKASKLRQNGYSTNRLSTLHTGRTSHDESTKYKPRVASSLDTITCRNHWNVF